MKITAIETLRTEEFANVIWVRVHTDAGIIGLGETFYGAGAVEAHIHDTLVGRLLGTRGPTTIARLVIAVHALTFYREIDCRALTHVR